MVGGEVERDGEGKGENSLTRKGKRQQCSSKCGVELRLAMASHEEGGMS